MRAVVDGTDLVVWRAANGEIAAWDNRCPHRGMALSHGFVRGNALACLYHGWHFERSGRCNYIPAHPDLEPPATIHATQHSVAEAHGVIWVDTAAQANAMPTSEARAPLRSFIVEASETALRRSVRSTPCAGEAPEAMSKNEVKIGSDIVAVLCNPHGAKRTQVTVLAGPALTVARNRALSRWCEGVRRRAEAEVAT